MAGKTRTEKARVILRQYTPEPEALQSIPEAMARKYAAIPLSMKGNILRVAMANPADILALEALESLSQKRIETEVATVEEIAPGGRKLIDFEEVTVALINIDGDLYCIEDVCTHDGGPVAEGVIEGFEIECPRHGARFDIRDGCALSMPAVTPVPTFKVRIEGKKIFIESPEEW